MNRLLLTGASGFIGRHVLQQLEGIGHEIHAVASGPAWAGSAAIWHRADLLDAAATDHLIRTIAPTHLLHLAWFAEPGAFWRSPRNLDWLASSALLIRAFREAGGQRVVTAGSCAEYGESASPCHETGTPCRPATLYGVAKNALQQVTTAYASQEGFSSAWARLFFIYGPGEAPAKLVASVVRSLLAGEEARCTHGMQQRDFMHVADVAAALIALLDSPVEGPVNIASGRPVAVRDLVGEIARQLGASDRLRLGAFAAGADDPAVIVGDPSRLRTEVGWTAERPMSEGIAQTIEWWRRQPVAQAR